jgi:hypothetical protein
MKIPEPIMDPTTRETAASGLIPRMNSEEVPGADAGAASIGAAMGVLVGGVSSRAQRELAREWFGDGWEDPSLRSG